jgi:hypothetical protein
MISPSSPVTVGDVRDRYDERDLYYREIWGEHVHHRCGSAAMRPSMKRFFI